MILPVSLGWCPPTHRSEWIYQGLQCDSRPSEALAEPQYWWTHMHMTYGCSRWLVSSPEVATLKCKRGRQFSLECRPICSVRRNTKAVKMLTGTRLACYNCRMRQGGKTFWLRHFGIELILFAQPCIKGSVGFNDKYSSQITGERAIGGEFDILVVRFISYHLQRPQIRNTGRVFNETVSSWLPPKRVPKKIPLFGGLGTQATFVRRGLICRV